MRARLLFLLLFAAAGSASGQDSIYFLRRTGGYGAFEFGPGKFQMTCDSCSGTNWGSGGINFYLGYQFSRRWRAEMGIMYQGNRESGNRVFGGTVGASVYLVGDLHVRGGLTYLNPNIDDSLSNFQGKGLGFLVGAGYDLYIGHSVAITPFVSYTHTSLSKITQTHGGITNEMAGSLKTIQFGISLTRLKVTYFCGNKRGKMYSQHDYGFRACLDRVAQE